MRASSPRWFMAKSVAVPRDRHLTPSPTSRPRAAIYRAVTHPLTPTPFATFFTLLFSLDIVPASFCRRLQYTAIPLYLCNPNHQTLYASVRLSGGEPQDCLAPNRCLRNTASEQPRIQQHALLEVYTQLIFLRICSAYRTASLHF